jgi:hypothetical protein
MNERSWGKRFEIGWPWTAAAVAAILAFVFRADISFADDIRVHLLDKLVDVCAISVGFWATALALLLALEDRKTVEGLRQLGIYNRIVSYFLVTVYSFFFLLLLCLVSIAFGRPSWVSRDFYIVVWGFVLSLCGCAMLRSFWILGKLLKAK